MARPDRPSPAADHPAQGWRPGLGQRAAIAAELRANGSVFAEDEAALLLAAAEDPDDVARLVTRRVGGEPLEQILGWVSFRGLRIAVAPGVFVPRRRSELLVREGRRLLTGRVPKAGPPVVVELCCGVAAVAAALAAEAPGIELHAADIDPAAVACARRNLPLQASVYSGDLFSPLPDALRERVDLLVANAPYVPTAEIEFMPSEARLYEPPAALDGGADGVEVHRRIAAGVAGWLAPGGTVLIETSVRQSPLTSAALTAAGLTSRTVRAESLDATLVAGRKRRSRSLRRRAV